MRIREFLMAGAFAAALAVPGMAAAKTLVVGVPDNMTGLDPTNVNDTQSQTSMRTIYQGLFGFDRNMKVVPLLAEGYTANEAATEFTIKLKSGIKFHDGTDFDAAAVKYNIERLANPDNKLSRRSLVSMVDKVDVIDATTVKITTKTPFGAMIPSLAHPGAMIISPAAVEKYGKDIGRNPVGTGPFKFKRWAADVLEVEKFDGYWKKGWPKVDGVTFRSVPENGARFAMVQAGEVHYALPFPSELVGVAEKNPNLVVAKEPSIVEWYVAINTTKKPFDNLKVRQALNHAVDKVAYCKIVYSGFCSPADSIIPPQLSFYKAQPQFAYDPAKAKALLAEAGFPNGFEAEMFANNNTTAIRAMQFLQQQFAAVGIKLTVTPLESGVMAQKIWTVQKPEEATVQLQYGGWSSSTGDADWGIRPLLYGKSAPPAMYNVAYYSNPKVDAAIEGALGTADPAKRAAFYEEAQKLAWADAPWVYLGVIENISVQAKGLSGVYMLPDRGFVVEDAEFK